MTGAGFPAKHIVIMWTNFLPYHVARIRHLRKRLDAIGWSLTAIEVASKDALYPFPEEAAKRENDYLCLFSGESYRELSPYIIHRRAVRALENLKPDVVIAPSTPFPSGMASTKYCLDHDKISVMMDDAWEYSDKRGAIVSVIKRIIHENVDAAFIPAPSHASYYRAMGFPQERIFYGVDVVDNDFFAAGAEAARREADALRRTLTLPSKYFIFVGRFIARKGIATLLEAYRNYAVRAGQDAWGLVLVGEGDERSRHENAMREYSGVRFVGSQFGAQLCRFYGLASAFILPSVVETWGLVANEALASGLPLIISNGCGAGKALVDEGVNGWTFPAGDSDALSSRMSELAAMPADRLESMGRKSQERIAHWSLDTFADGVIASASVARRAPAGFLSDFLTRFWNGRISFYP
ncbi:MAG TPA: glycosyltransferase family 4 protein [Bacteroidota bacterium]|nr:glycosyltransferase family 4 protein [Bacteroidota bacterium]